MMRRSQVGTYADNPLNRKLGRVGKPLGSHVVHNSSQSKTYADNPANRKLGRAGEPKGSHVVHKDGSVTVLPTASHMPPGFTAGIPTGSHMPHNDETTTYVDNPLNRRLGRVGKPIGSHVLHKDGSVTVLPTDSHVLTGSTSLDSAMNSKRVPHMPSTLSTNVGHLMNRSRGISKLVQSAHKDGIAPCATCNQTSTSNPRPVRVSRPIKSHVLQKDRSTNVLPIIRETDENTAGLTASRSVVATEAPRQDEQHSSCVMSSTISSNDQNNITVLSGSVAHTDSSTPDSKPSKNTSKQNPIIPREEVNITEQELYQRGSDKVYCGHWRNMKIMFEKFNIENKPPKWVTKLRHEIQLLCQLTHPNLVRIFGGILEKNLYGVVMEFVPCSLFQALLVEKRMFDKEDRAIWVRQISSGLEFLHSKDVVHCNLTSKNVLLTEYNTAKIIGYGPKFQISNVESIYDLVREADPSYAAPELLQMELLAIGSLKHADIYALAVVSYEVLESCSALSSMLQEAIMEKKTLIVRNMSKSMLDILRKCWDVRASQRPTASEFIEMWKGHVCP